jgi:hypothetical protein
MTELLKHIGNDQLIKRLSKTLATGIQLSENDVFLVGMAIFSSVATRKYFVAYEYESSIPIGLYVVAEQPPASAKTRLQAAFKKPFDAVDDDKRKLYKKALGDLEKQLKDCEDKEEKKELKKQIKETKDKPVPLLFITNTTSEALEKSLIQTNGFFSLVSSEQTLFDTMLGLSYGDSSKANNNEVVLNGFDAGKSGTLRIGRETYSGIAVGGVALFAQNGSIEKILNASNGTGLSERFLMLSEPHLLGKRKHVNAPDIDRAITDEYEVLAKSIALRALDKDSEVDNVITLTISEYGHRQINEFRDKIEPDLGDGGAYAVHKSMRGAAGKANMQIMKMAANLHLLDGGEDELEIADKHVDSAIAIVEYTLNAMLGLCEQKELVGEKAENNAIFSYLKKKSTGATANDMINSLKSTKPFKDMACGKNEAIRKTLARMTDEASLTELNGVYSVK